MHGLDAPVAAKRFAKAFAAEISAGDIIPHFVCFAAVGGPGEANRIADRLDPRPVRLDREILGNLGEAVSPFVQATMFFSSVS